MADISTNSLGRTQQAGQGTAFIYEPMSNTKPLDAQIKSLRQRAEAIINAADGLAEYKAINITAPTMELN